MTVASLELCKELYELGGWDDVEHSYTRGGDIVHNKLDGTYEQVGICPAYDLGYLLRKLLPYVAKSKYEIKFLTLVYASKADGGWICDYKAVMSNNWLHEGNRAKLTEADTPEDAACKLAIELFKQNILTKENRENEKSL